MPATQERVNIIVNYIQKGMSKFRSQANNVNRGLKESGKILSETDPQWRKHYTSQGRIHKGYIKNKSALGRFTATIRDGTRGMRGFNMNMLSIMFGGMMLQQTFMGILNPALEAFGIFDMFSTMLLVLMIPVMEWLAPLLFQIMEWFMNLPDPVKQVIGILVIVGAVVGTLLATFGSLSLFIGGLIPVFGSIIAAILPFVPIILAIIAIVTLLWLAWETNFGNIQQHVTTIVNGIMGIIDGLISYLRGSFEWLWGLITGDPEMVKQGWQKIVDGIKGIIKGFVDIGKGIIGFIVDGIKSAAGWIWDIIKNIMIIPPWTIGQVVEGAMGVASAIGGALGGIFGGGGTVAQDFIWRAGQPPMRFSSDDNITASKGEGGAGGNTVNVTVNTGGISNSVDVDNLARRIGEEVNRQLSGRIR